MENLLHNEKLNLLRLLLAYQIWEYIHMVTWYGMWCLWCCMMRSCGCVSWELWIQSGLTATQIFVEGFESFGCLKIYKALVYAKIALIIQAFKAVHAKHPIMPQKSSKSQKLKNSYLTKHLQGQHACHTSIPPSSYLNSRK